MSTVVAPTQQRDGEYTAWRDRTRVVLQPIAPPSILGLAGFSAATLIVASNLAGWYGTPLSPRFLFPFALAFGGIAQLAAGIVSYRARDAVATLAHGMWGSFWIGYGILWAFIAAGAYTPPTGKWVELGFWFIPLAYLTLTATVAAAFESLGIALVLFLLGTGSALVAAGLMSAGVSSIWTKAGGWVLVASAVAAWYVVAAMLLMATSKRTILPTLQLEKSANIPGRKPRQPIEAEWSEPGVKQGQ